ncbi:MAG: DinB family protein [Planctomycetota bacterium]
MAVPEQQFRTCSVHYLRDTYVPRIRRASEILPADRLWWRPHEGVPSVGNLLLHLSGNVRQWILSGLGQQPDVRQRIREFMTQEEGGVEPLLADLTGVVDEAADIVAGLSKAEWEQSHVIQGFAVTPLEAVYHVVEHFSWHTGQIVWIAKSCAGAQHGLAFYDEAEINRRRNEPEG